MPVPNIASKREEDGITRTGQRFDFICPFIGIFTEFIHGDRTHVAVSPAVGGKLPAVIPKTLGYLTDSLFICLIVWIGALIGRVCPIAKNSLIAGKRQNGPRTAVGKIRVFRNEILQKRNKIIGADGHGTVVHHHLTGGLSVLTDDHPACETITGHILIIAEIIL